MRYIRSIISPPERGLAAATVLLGAAIIGLAFFVSPAPLQAALGLAGTGGALIGLAQLRRAGDAAKLDRILAELEEIREKLENTGEPEGGRTALSDVITTGLKMYADRIGRTKAEEE